MNGLTPSKLTYIVGEDVEVTGCLFNSMFRNGAGKLNDVKNGIVFRVVDLEPDLLVWNSSVSAFQPVQNLTERYLGNGLTSTGSYSCQLQINVGNKTLQFNTDRLNITVQGRFTNPCFSSVLS